MVFKDALIDASKEVLSRFGITPVYLKETENELLASASQVNILIGLTVPGLVLGKRTVSY